MLPADENSIILCSFVLTQYRRITHRQTDERRARQTDRNANTAHSIATRSKIMLTSICNASEFFTLDLTLLSLLFTLWTKQTTRLLHI